MEFDLRGYCWRVKLVDLMVNNIIQSKYIFAEIIK